MKTKTIFLVLLLLSVKIALPQINKQNFSNPISLQYGFTVKGVLEFSFNKQMQKPVFRLSTSVGVGSNFLTPALYPSIHIECLLYNGGFGSHKPGFHKAPVTLDVITALTLTAGIKNYFTAGRANLLAGRHIPLYYFADFAYPALQNPYSYSLSIGTNIIFTTDHYKTRQRIGFFNLHADCFQLSYYNDGGVPISDIYLGDRRDRYYTGGAVISYHGKPYTALNLIEVSYHKYTGYSKNAFEVSNKLDLAFVNYNLQEQKYYNKSMWTLTIANPTKGAGASIQAYNKLNWDIQHLIHWSLFNAYHMSPYPDYFTISGNYYGAIIKNGLR